MTHKNYYFIVAVFCAAAGITAGLHAQNVDYNEYYRFPVSVGVGYRSLTAINPQVTDPRIMEVYLDGRLPVPSLPVLQPMIRLGFIQTDVSDVLFPDRWDHSQWYGVVGAGYVNRFSKDFELGAFLLTGYSQSVFPNLVPDEPLGAGNWVSTLEGVISLAPSYNMAVDVRPSISYWKTFSPLTDFDGLYLGISFSAHYRIGEDPESLSNLIRSLKIEGGEIGAVFGAMQSYYATNPVGMVTITNTERWSLTDVEISFYQAGYMDSPTRLARFDELQREESREIDILASFNDEVFLVEGVKPVTGEIIAQYNVRGRPAEQRYSVSYDLYDKHSIIWDDDRKVAAFITQEDSAIRNYASFVRQAAREVTIGGYSSQIQTGMQIYAGMTAQGCIYQVDPVSPFAEVQENNVVIDSVSLPRETLKRITGDCDDLTVLYNSLLESVGVETAFITTPGHIYSAINTGIEVKDYRMIHPDRSLTIEHDGLLWMPVEITMIGTAGFLEAWRRGAEEWQTYNDEPGRRGFYLTRQSQNTYRSVGLKETDLGLLYGEGKEIEETFSREISRHATIVLSEFRDEVEEQNNAKGYNNYGIVLAKFGRYRDSEQAFRTASRMDDDYLSPRVNLANVAYLTDDYRTAMRSYREVEAILESKGRISTPFAQKIILNISKTLYELEQYADAREYFTKANSIGGDDLGEFAYLGADAGSRAASAETGNVLFVDEE